MKILLIEDELALSDALRQVLIDEHYMVDAVYDGLDGLNSGLSGVYDVIILDVMLPKMNGFEILKELRKEKINTPILMLTAKSDLDSKVMGLDSGADYYLTKPFQTGELLACLRVITRRKGEIIESKLSFGDLELKVKQGEIFCLTTNMSVKLGVKELQILELLLRNQNQILDKESMVEKIWGYDSEAEYNNIEVYMSFIRKKIAFIGSSVKIKATRGIGYSLEVLQ